MYRSSDDLVAAKNGAGSQKCFSIDGEPGEVRGQQRKMRGQLAWPELLHVVCSQPRVPIMLLSIFTVLDTLFIHTRHHFVVIINPATSNFHKANTAGNSIPSVPRQRHDLSPMKSNAWREQFVTFSGTDIYIIVVVGACADPSPVSGFKNTVLRWGGI